MFPYRAEGDAVEIASFTSAAPPVVNESTITCARAIIPVNNCEYWRALEQAGAVAETPIINTRTRQQRWLPESTEALVKAIENTRSSRSLAVLFRRRRAGFAGLFITQPFRAPPSKWCATCCRTATALCWASATVSGAVVNCAVFGDIRPMDEGSALPISRSPPSVVRAAHARYRFVAVARSRCEVGDIHTVRELTARRQAVARSSWSTKLAANGQIATQWMSRRAVDEPDVNPNGSVLAIDKNTV